MMVPEEIFDRVARRHRRARSQRSPAADRWLLERMSDDLVDRLGAIRRSIAEVLIVGDAPPGVLAELAERDASVTLAGTALPAHPVAGIICDEDRLPLRDESFDLVLAFGTLDTVGDLPGALILIRRALRPDGLFMGAMMGAGSLVRLRECVSALGGDAGRIARFHPQIDVRGAGDLLARAGFVMPVADSETVSVHYSGLARLVGDLRANGLTSVLPQRPSFSRSSYRMLIGQFAKVADQGLPETFNIISMTGWAPAVRQSS